MVRIINISKIILFLSFINLLCFCENKNHNLNLEERFEGTWTSTVNVENSIYSSLYIKKSNSDIFDCYFISSNGNEMKYKAILEENVLKIGNLFTIKYLEESESLYLQEEAIPFNKTEPFEVTLEKLRKDIYKSNTFITSYMYFPFQDTYAKEYRTYGDTYDYYYMRDIGNNLEKIDKLFSNRNIDCLLSSDVMSYEDTVNDEFGYVFLRPYEYAILCYDENRSYHFKFSLRNGKYLIYDLQSHP